MIHCDEIYVNKPLPPGEGYFKKHEIHIQERLNYCALSHAYHDCINAFHMVSVCQHVFGMISANQRKDKCAFENECDLYSADRYNLALYMYVQNVRTQLNQGNISCVNCK